MSELEDKLNTLGIEMESKHLNLVIPSKVQKDAWAHDLWEIQLKFQKQSFTTIYRTGLGHRVLGLGVKKTAQGKYYRADTTDLTLERACEKHLLKPVKPSVADVIHSLMMDSDGSDQPFEDWCYNFDYNNDSIKALNIYLECQKTKTQMIKLFGIELYNSLVGLEH